MENSTCIGYLHFGEDSEPRQTVSVKVRCLHSDNWQAFYAAKWRKVYIQNGKTYLMEWTAYGFISVISSNMKHSHQSIHEGERFERLKTLMGV